MADFDFTIDSFNLPSLAMDASHLAGRSFDKDDQAARQVARDFESILLTRLTEAMSQTVPDSGLFDDSITKQVKGMFWSFLAQDVGERGGMGMWQEIYRQIKPPAPASDTDGATMEQLL